MLHAARCGTRWLKVSKLFSLLGGLSGVSEVKAPFARVAPLAASGRRAATAAALTSATAPATRHRHNAFFLDIAVLGDPLLATTIKPEPCCRFCLLICCRLNSEAVFRAWVCDRSHYFWHAEFLARRTPAGISWVKRGCLDRSQVSGQTSTQFQKIAVKMWQRYLNPSLSEFY